MAKNRWILPDGFDKSSREAVKAILSALETSGKEIPPEAFTALQLGDVAGFLEFVNWDQIRNEFGDLTEIMRLMASTAGQSTFTMGGVQSQLLFDLIDARAVDYAQKRVGELIVDISEQMRETVRDTIARASAGEMTYQQAALRLQSTISLTPRDAGAANKFIEKQYQRFMRSGLSDARARIKAQNMGAKYASKLLRSRTNTIARTEIADAAMAGRYLGWEAGVTAGLISNESVKEWIAEPNACPICKALDGKVIGWNKAWDFPEGVSAGLDNNMPPAHPNCRCSVAILPPDFADNVFTPSSGGEMPEEAEEFVKPQTIGEAIVNDPNITEISYDESDFSSIDGLKITTPEQRAALDKYTSYGYSDMNRYLRKGKFPMNSSPMEQDVIVRQTEALKELVNSSVITKPIKVRRGQTYGGLPDELDLSGGFIEPEAIVGQVFESKGFLSTAAYSMQGYPKTSNWLKKEVIMEINIPAGSRGGGILDSAELEILLPPNSRFLVTGARDNGNWQTVVQLVLVGQ
jgi:hypothetical protein